MSSANPPAKRRRHDTASSTLSKPFKSPLRQRPPQSTEQPYPPSSTTTNPNTKDEPKPNPQETSNQPNTPPPRHPQNPAAAAAPTPPPSTTPKPRPNPKAKSTDPTHHAAQTQHRTLQTRLAALRSDLDTAAQAQRIESSAKASELQALIAKWKAVAQDAAEEVFVGASERVGRMGGMEGYKERVRESKAAAARWDEEEEDRSVKDEGEREDVKKEEEEKEKENEGEKEVGSSFFVWLAMVGVLTRQEFTMEFMLKTLNIDPKTIGYDCAGQRWVK